MIQHASISVMETWKKFVLVKMLYPNKIEIIIIVELFFKIDISILDVCLLFLPPITSSSMCHELTIL